MAPQIVAETRLNLLERAFALVDTPRFFDNGLSFRLKKTRMVLACHCKRWWKFPELATYACWLEELLDKALPEESLCLVALEFRHEQAGEVDDDVDRLHADGSYIRSVYTLYGPSTIYRYGQSERPVPCGQTLLMTAMDRARAIHVPCTLHKRPGAGPERAVIVCSFEPKEFDPSLSNVCRQVVEKTEQKHPSQFVSSSFRRLTG